MNKIHCGQPMIGVEYDYGDPYRYDGVSEWWCKPCGTRLGRWTDKKLKKGEQEPPYGEVRKITNNAEHYNV